MRFLSVSLRLDRAELVCKVGAFASNTCLGIQRMSFFDLDGIPALDWVASVEPDEPVIFDLFSDSMGRIV